MPSSCCDIGVEPAGVRVLPAATPASRSVLDSAGAGELRFPLWIRRGRDGSVSVRVMRGHLLSDLPGYSGQVTTPALPMFGNRVVLAVAVHNATAGLPTAKIALQGSYNRRTWKSTAAELDLASPLGPPSIALGRVDFAYVRIRAWLIRTDVSIRFDASIVFSEQ